MLRVHHLSVRFPIRTGVPQCAHESFTVVGAVSFTIAASPTLGLLGASGCGKTSAGKVIVQLPRGRAVIEGQALFKGQDLFALEGAALLAALRSVRIIL